MGKILDSKPKEEGSSPSLGVIYMSAYITEILVEVIKREKCKNNKIETKSLEIVFDNQEELDAFSSIFQSQTVSGFLEK